MDVTTKDGNRILIPVTNVDSVRIINESEYNTPSGSHNGYEYVDLGLSVMWASYNVGANSPEEIGDLFAWGEVTPKDEYTFGNYIYYKDDIPNKYVKDSTSTYFDGKTTLDKCDDAARCNMGGSWRMPTVDEIQELIENTTYVRTILNGIEGYRLFSKINGNNIFLPLYSEKDGMFYNIYYIYYWSSSTMDSNVDLGAIAFNNLNIGGYYRYYGFSVRAVYSATTNIPTTMTLTFDANGGSGEMSPIIVYSDDNSHSVAIPYNIDIIVRKNYKFIG